MNILSRMYRVQSWGICRIGLSWSWLGRGTQRNEEERANVCVETFALPCPFRKLVLLGEITYAWRKAITRTRRNVLVSCKRMPKKGMSCMNIYDAFSLFFFYLLIACFSYDTNFVNPSIALSKSLANWWDCWDRQQQPPSIHHLWVWAYGMKIKALCRFK